MSMKDNRQTFAPMGIPEEKSSKSFTEQITFVAEA
jgi:hypothetical protein